MSIDVNDEILQDFLVEAGEILEQLSEQLVDLEQQPDDYDLLNTVFRGFHTIKGGAGFLGIDSLVVVCHRAEDVFNILRQGQRQVSPDLMDAVLQVLDVVNSMFDEIRQGVMPDPADPELIERLNGFSAAEEEDQAEPAANQTEETVAVAEPEQAAVVENAGAAAGPRDLSDHEFEELLDAIQEPAEAKPSGDEITEDEFEGLLDDLHGKGKFNAGMAKAGAANGKPATGANAATDEITEDEFEALLDNIHGKGKFDPAKSAAQGSASVASAGRAGATAAQGSASVASAGSAGSAGATAAQGRDRSNDPSAFPPSMEVRSASVASAGRTGATAAQGRDRSNDPSAFPPSMEVRSASVASAGRTGATAVKSKAASPSEAKQPALASGDDEITEDEFDSLLDEIHGKGKFKTQAAGAPAKQAAKQAPAKPAVKPQQKPPTPPAEAKAKAAPKPKTTAETTVRVDTQRLDDIMNMVGELVLVRNRLANLKATMNDEDVSNAVGNLDVVTADLQLAVMKTRMQPIKKVFGRFPRVVRDLARTLKKEIDLEMRGEDTDLDKNLVEALADPLVHLVRNSVDHGIELPDEREAAGKPRRGTVLLSAAQEGDHILLSISDDGKGMDPNVLRQKAVEKGMMDQEAAARLDDRECYNLIFQPGFSTKQVISDVSGRGVGMDVVKTRIAQMNGSVEIDSEYGRGSLITIKLPLTLAILPTLMVVLGEQPFALPLASVVEIFNLDLRRTNQVDGQLTIMVRERAIPLFYLRQWLVPENPVAEGERHTGHVVIVNVSNIQVGLVVDDLIGQEEVVIKPLGALLQGLDGMAGATITGDGKIALIIDVPGLMRKYAHKY